ncbi:MAG: hypothetical protein NTV46_09895 [Verrucomicrobia bacterium]|nr:hypothetical protein [Verrucomicrobiota bacterium]
MKTQNIIQPLRNHLKPLALAGAVLCLATSAQAVPVTILNGSFEEGLNSITATVDGLIPGKGIGYVTYDCVEYPDIQKDNKFDDSLANPPNTAAPNQPTGNAGRPRYWTYTGNIIQDNIATDSRWPGVWNSWTAGPTDGRTAIILDNRSWEGGVPSDGSGYVFAKQTLSLNVGQLKALGSSLKLHFDAREREGDQTANPDDLDGDSFIKVYFEVNGVQDVAGTWETRFDATRKVRTFTAINGVKASTYYSPTTATRDNPARNKPGTVGPQNMDPFFATLDLSAYSNDSAAVTMVIENRRFRDGATQCPSGRVYMDNIRVEAVSSASPYDTWAAANANNEDPDLDYNNDGVANGVAYFMDATGLATNPGIVGGSVTWPNGAKIPKTEYGAGKQFVVQTSSDLQVWNDVADTDPNLILTDYSAGPPVVEASVKYTLPTGAAKSFVRFKVTPN